MTLLPGDLATAAGLFVAAVGGGCVFRGVDLRQGQEARGAQFGQVRPAEAVGVKAPQSLKTGNLWSDPRLLWVGLSVLAFGVLLHILPVSTQVNGTKVGCGNSIIRDRTASENYDIKYSTYAYSEILGYRSNNPRPAGWEYATSNCTDRLVVQRWIAWPLTLLGAGLAVRGVVNRRQRAVAAARQAGYSGQPAETIPQGSAVLDSSSFVIPPVRPVAGASGPLPTQDTPFAPPMGPPMQLPPPQAAAGWYPSPTTPHLIQWYDGRQWTHHTQPLPQQ